MRTLSSRDNPLFRRLMRAAGKGPGRAPRGERVLEGVHLCRAWLEAHGAPLACAVTREGARHEEVASLLAGLGHLAHELADPLFRQLSDVAAGVGLVFLVEVPSPQWPARLTGDLVYLDRVQDPGNVGTILRTCVAVGVRTVVTAPGTVACWSPKVVRSAMGAHFHLTLYEGVEWARFRQAWAGLVRATAGQARETVFAADLRTEGAWVLGSEGSGVDPAIMADSLLLSIPQSAQIESLNVGVAASICLYEQWRQRQA
jgi:TrmH family RNA methyltransferase